MTDDTGGEEGLAEMREEDSYGTRADPVVNPELVDALVEALEAVESGDRSDTLSAYDPNLAAVLTALEDDDRLEETFEQLQEAYEGDSGLTRASRSAIVRLAVRVGLQEGTADVMDNLEKAVSRHEEPTL